MASVLGKNIVDNMSLRRCIFVALGFLLGAINMLYSEVYYVLIVLALLINWYFDWKVLKKDMLQEWHYLVLPLVFVFYIVVHYIVSLFVGVAGKTSWSSIESLLLYFFILPLYWLSVKPFLTPSLLRKFLIALCCGVLLLSLCKFFYLTGNEIWVHPIQVLQEIYKGRFGFNMGFWGGYFYLEPHACYLCISSLIAAFFFLTNFGWKKYFFALLLFLSLLFLSYTVTKGAICGMVLGCIILFGGILRYWSWKKRIVSMLLVILIAWGIGSLLSGVYNQRYNELKREIVAMKEGKLLVGSFSGRIRLLKANMNHVNEFGCWGLGVYKKQVVEKWYEKYPGNTHAHNSFMEYWVLGGVLGLFFVLYYFVAPIVRMVRLHKYSILGLAVIIALFFMNNTTILIILVDSSPLVITMLVLLYFYVDKFNELEQCEILNN